MAGGEGEGVGAVIATASGLCGTGVGSVLGGAGDEGDNDAPRGTCLGLEELVGGEAEWGVIG